MSDSQSPTEPGQFSNQQPYGQGPADQQPWSGQPQQPASQWGGQPPSEPIDPTAGQYGQQGQPYPGQYGQADPYAGQHGAPAGWSGGQGQQSGFLPNDDKSFFASLFDFSFSSFVTPKIVKAVYIVVTAVIGLGIVATLITAFVSRQGATIVLALILAPLVGLIYLALARMTLEMYYAIIRLSEDVHKSLPPQ